MSWFKREKRPIENSEEDRKILTEGLWIKCDGCNETLWRKDLESNLNVCPKCGHHYKISALERLNLLLDPGWKELDGSLHSTGPLEFVAAKSCKDSLAKLPSKLGVREAVISAHGTLNGVPVYVAAMEYSFIGGSMGSVVGEKITRAIEYA